MPRLLERVRKLRGATIDELRVRCAQAARARLERFGLSPDSRLPTDAAFAHECLCGAVGNRDKSNELWAGFRRRARSSQCLLPGLVDPEGTARELQQRFPAAAAATIAAADRIAAGEVDLGNRVVSIGARPDWTV